MEKKKISASQIVKFMFPDAYKDIPEWILQKAADFGKDLHESIQAYIEQPDLDEEITEALITDNKIRLYQAFKQWFKEQEIKDAKTEHYLQTEKLHGYIDLISFEENKIWDYKFRNIDKKLDILKDVIQLKFYEILLNEIYHKWFRWELVIFDKKTAQIYTFSNENLTMELNTKLDSLIYEAINFLWNKQEMNLQAIGRDSLIKWNRKAGDI